MLLEATNLHLEGVEVLDYSWDALHGYDLGILD